MTISINDIRRFETETTPKAEAYSPRKDRAAWELATMDVTPRGSLCERIIADQIEQTTGIPTRALEGNGDYDVMVGLDNRPVRVEVKSCICNKKAWTNFQAENYTIAAVKPELFDFLFAIKIRPYGVEVKWCHTSDLQGWITQKRGQQGYRLPITNWPDFFYDLEDFPGDF